MRVRDIIHRDGARLRLSLAPGERGEGPLIRLTEPGREFSGTITLDLYGAELLAGFLMSARLSAVGDMPDECCSGDYPLRLRLAATWGEARVELDQSGQHLALERALWDRTYTELQLVVAHGRHLGGAAPGSILPRPEVRRLLH